MLLLTACASESVVHRTDVSVPAALVRPCDRPEIAPQTAQGLAEGITLYDGHLVACSSRMQAVRAYLEEQEVEFTGGEAQE